MFGAKWAITQIHRAAVMAEIMGMRSRWRTQDKLDKVVVRSWRRFDQRRRETTLFATAHGVLPEIRDYAEAFAPVLDRLQPDVIHAHHPFVLRTAVRAARRRRAAGHPCCVVYDARENFAGIPEGEQGSPRRHAMVVRQEADMIRHVDRVITVSDPIADELQARFGLTRRPAVVLNVPISAARSARRTIRDVVGVDSAIPLLVYSGGISRARGLETLVDAMGLLPDMHLALVAVPHPHPSIPGLLERAAALGAEARVHVTGPVAQGDIATFLSGADIAVHPLPGGSPNHDQALPNKLFEYLHAGLPLVVSDARMMADFVMTEHVGQVFATGDAAALASAVQRVREEPPSPETIAEVAHRCSWQGQEALLLALYDGLTGFSSKLDSEASIDVTVEDARSGASA
ncbi:hypothetical protein N864_06430 [Intrasporangium chromatireducens Q5-1]|uniref:Glycosyltransferase subfamily 4-like N-terminal domain-containing protein n=1 Tax=Intrasporangium chromatireducens Q5-1 TaxID=584657 RepID=W9GN89_9MICO|nr:glycosyltransferase family 4 protein [Intrasporangium chromatireducens]EWT07570.1 hypothetical protein N864_06430 [Intrasporangium chromatireducens Q5-1]